MTTKQQIQSIKQNSERVVEGIRTQSQEFVYELTRGFVKENTLYSAYYTDDKREVYLTGLQSSGNSKLILRVKNKTLFGEYTDLKRPSRTPYPKPKVPQLKDGDYELGSVDRFFAQVANDYSKQVFEIDKEQFENQNSLYRYISFSWIISGLKEDVSRQNSLTMRTLQRDFPTITKVLFPLQFWRPSLGTKDDVENKLSRLKI